jgi:hypothetical protein
LIEEEDGRDEIEKRYGEIDPIIRKMVEIPEDDPLEKIEDEEKRDMLKLKRQKRNDAIVEESRLDCRFFSYDGLFRRLREHG